MTPTDYKSLELKCLKALEYNFFSKRDCTPLVLNKDRYAAIDGYTRSGLTLIAIEHKYRTEYVSAFSSAMMEKEKIESFKRFYELSGGSSFYIMEFMNDVVLIFDVSKLIHQEHTYQDMLCPKNQFSNELVMKPVIFLPYESAVYKLINYQRVDSIQHLMNTNNNDFELLKECGII